MAKMVDYVDEMSIKKMTLGELRKQAIKLNENHRKIMDGEFLRCEKCGRQLVKTAFYRDSRFISGVNTCFCKDCIQKIAENRKTDKEENKETKDSIRAALKILDRPFINSVYNDAIAALQKDTGERSKKSIFSYMYPQLVTLPQQIDKKYADSDPDDEDEAITSDNEINPNSKIIKDAKKRFGQYQIRDLYFLGHEWSDWCARYEIATKAQEVLLQQICLKELELDKLTRNGKDTSKQIKDLQDLMGSLNVKPNQNTGDGVTDAKSFGQLIEEWEEHDPVIEPSGEQKDPQHMVALVDGFMRGHTCKMMGLKNAYSSLYDDLMSKYSVDKDNEEDDDWNNEDLFNKIFGSEIRKEDPDEQ